MVIVFEHENRTIGRYENPTGGKTDIVLIPDWHVYRAQPWQGEGDDNQARVQVQPMSKIAESPSFLKAFVYDDSTKAAEVKKATALFVNLVKSAAGDSGIVNETDIDFS